MLVRRDDKHRGGKHAHYGCWTKAVQKSALRLIRHRRKRGDP